MRAGCSGRGLGSVDITVLRSRFNVSPRTVEAGDFITVTGSGLELTRSIAARFLVDATPPIVGVPALP